MRYCLLILLFIGCQNTDEYPYLDAFAQYMKDIHREDIYAKERVYYATPLNSCEPCVVMNLEMLGKLPKNEFITIILVGEASNKEIEDLASDVINSGHRILFDRETKIFPYATGYGKPILVHIDGMEVRRYMEVVNPLVKDAEVYMRTCCN